jgi:adenosine kinase
VVIEGSVLLRRAPDRYTFHLVVRNHADIEIAAPALELTLTDAQDRVLVRRVWLPAEWPQPRATLAPGQEWPAAVRVGVRSPAGGPHGRLPGSLVLSLTRSGLLASLFHDHPRFAVPWPSTPSWTSKAVFADHILPDQLHILKRGVFGAGVCGVSMGAARGNIAYGLRQLGAAVRTVATLGADGQPYLGAPASHGGGRVGAAGHARAFHRPGDDHDGSGQQPDHGVSSPERWRWRTRTRSQRRPTCRSPSWRPMGKQATWTHAEQLHAAGVPFVFDPGQGFADVRRRRTAAVGRVGRLGPRSMTTRPDCCAIARGLSLAALSQRLRALVVTLGEHGCDVWQDGQCTRVPGERASAIVDPTGCGDAFRAALLYGLAHGWGVEQAARLGNPHGRGQDRHPRRAELPFQPLSPRGHAPRPGGGGTCQSVRAQGRGPVGNGHAALGLSLVWALGAAAASALPLDLALAPDAWVGALSPADSPLAALSVLPALAVFFAFGASSFEAVAFEALTTLSALTAGAALGVAVFALGVFFAGAFTAVFSVVFFGRLFRRGR